MNKFKTYLSIIIILQVSLLSAKPQGAGDADLKSPPPRIIRVCCAFGADLNFWGIPFVKLNHITSLDQLGTHKYMGGDDEGNGVIYTKNGGFIDIGHLRDQADWTKYLYALILSQRENGEFVKKLGYEGGPKNLHVYPNMDLDSTDCLLMAGKIAYDLSLWHELSTWFGASEVPMMPERYSSFSVEDVYSNLLGVHIAIEALKSDMPYDEAMTEILNTWLDSLNTVKTEEETYLAYESVRNVWWSNDKRLPSSKVILARDTDVSLYSQPWLVPDSVFGHFEPHVLYIPKTFSSGKLITDYYDLQIDLNFKFPVKEMFPERDNRLITQDDFDIMLKRVDLEVLEKEPDTLTDREPLKPKGERQNL